MDREDMQNDGSPTPQTRLGQASGLIRFLWGAQGTLRTRVLRSSVWVATASVLQNLLQTGRSVVLARLLSPEAFGLMGLCMIVIRGLDLFTETGFGAALIQRQDDIDKAKNTAFVMQALRGLALTVLACAVAPFAAKFYGEPRLTLLLTALALAFSINGFSNINTVLLEKRLDFRLLSLLELAVALVSTGVVIGLAVLTRSVWAMAIGHLVMVTSRLVLSYVLVPGRPTFSFDRATAQELYRYGRFITGLTIALFLTTEADNLIVGKLLGLEALGLYTMAYMLANLPATHVSKVASRVLFPAYSAIQGDLSKLGQSYLSVVRLVGGVAVPAAFGLGVLAPEITRVVYGERWIGASPALRILAVFGAMRAISSLGGYVLQAVGKPNVNFYLVSSKLLVILALLPWCTTHFGIEGAAMAVTVPQVLFDIFSLGVVVRLVRLQLMTVVSAVGRTVVCSAIMAVAVTMARQRMSTVGPVELFGLVMGGGAFYAVLSYSEFRDLYFNHLRPALAVRTR